MIKPNGITQNLIEIFRFILVAISVPSALHATFTFLLKN